jgi:hypothetical protein
MLHGQDAIATISTGVIDESIGTEVARKVEPLGGELHKVDRVEKNLHPRNLGSTARAIHELDWHFAQVDASFSQIIDKLDAIAVTICVDLTQRRRRSELTSKTRKYVVSSQRVCAWRVLSTAPWANWHRTPSYAGCLYHHTPADAPTAHDRRECYLEALSRPLQLNKRASPSVQHMTRLTQRNQKESIVRAGLYAALMFGALIYNGYGSPEYWFSDELLWVIEGMLKTHQLNPSHFAYPAGLQIYLTSIGYKIVTAFSTNPEVDRDVLIHIGRSVSALFFLSAVFFAEKTVSLINGRRYDIKTDYFDRHLLRAYPPCSYRDRTGVADFRHSIAVSRVRERDCPGRC